MNNKILTGLDEGGFTLVELLVAMAIFFVIVAGIYETYISLHQTWVNEDVKAELQQSTRVAMDSMVRELMMTGYGAAKADIKISKASANEIEFKEFTKNNGTSKLYSVYYHIVGGDLVRDIKDADHMELGYPSSDQRTLARNVDSLNINYYYADSPPDTPASIGDFNYDSGIEGKRDDIRRVTITVKVKGTKPLKKWVGTHFDYQNVTMTLRADISLRNMYEGEMTLDSEKPNPVASLRVIDVRDCGHLRVKWPKSPETDVVGYLIQYGTTSGSYSSYQDVGIGSLVDPDNPEYDIPVNYSPYLTNDVTYFVNIQAYDRSHNYSDLRPADISGNPFYDITSFGQSGNDTACNKRKPAPPGNFTATGQNRAIKLTWAPPAYEGLVGYRVFRSYSAISSSVLPLNDEPYNLNSGNRIIEVAHEPGSGWTGPTLDQNATSFTDNDTNLIGCRPYYYTICAVGCDWTLVLGDGTNSVLHNEGRYTSAQYANASASPLDDLVPGPPTISTGSRPGWKRVFIQHMVPTVNADGTPIKDYAYTRLYYTYTSGGSEPNDPPPPDPPMPNLTSPCVPVADVDIDGDGFNDIGTVKVNKTILFNNLTVVDYDPALEPMLPVNSKFRILAVAYDKCGNHSSTTDTIALTLAELCGDDPVGYPTWPVCQTTVPAVWFSADSNELNTVNWVGTPAQTSLTVNWTDVDKIHPQRGWTETIDNGDGTTSTVFHPYVCPDDPGGMIDFQGYNVRHNTTGSFSIIMDRGDYNPNDTNTDAVGQWEKYKDVGYKLEEGNTYYFCVQSSDCYFWSHAGALMNVSPNSSMPPDGIKPGRLKKYDQTDLAHPEYNAATTSGTYHNIVKFYLENTSLANLRLDSMIFAWDNSVPTLKKVTIGPLDDGTSRVITLSSGSYIKTELTNIAFPLSNQAFSPIQPSHAIPMTLEFASASGVVNDSVDMRGTTISMQFGFANFSIPDVGGNPLSGFTTPDYDDPLHTIAYLVTFGATINSVKQNLPVVRTPGFEVDTTGSTYTAPPSGFPELNGGADVTVSSDVSVPPAESISRVKVYYTQTDLSATDPSSATFDVISSAKAGTIYNATIPGASSQATWYYVEASTKQGNVTRSPITPGSYYYYTSSAFDPCRETPTPPTNLTVSTSLPPYLTWTAPTKYVSGSTINSLDSLTYNVYRTIGLSGSPVKINTTNHLYYGDSAYSTYTSINNHLVQYNVSASNSCPNEGDMSNAVTVCPAGGSDCVFYVTPQDIYAGQSITVSLASCGAANNTTYNQQCQLDAVSGVGSKSVYLYENDDSGTARLTFNTTNTGAVGALPVIPANSASDTINISVTGDLVSDCSAGMSATVHAYADPSKNIPAAPILTSISGTGANRTLNWTQVTTNTDGSPAEYFAGSLPPESITGYVVRFYYDNGNPTTPPDPNADLSSWGTVVTTNANTFSCNVKLSNGYTYFTVRALDTFGQGTFSPPLELQK